MSDSDDMDYPPLKRVNSTKDYGEAPHDLEFEVQTIPEGQGSTPLYSEEKPVSSLFHRS